VKPINAFGNVYTSKSFPPGHGVFYGAVPHIQAIWRAIAAPYHLPNVLLKIYGHVHAGTITSRGFCVQAAIDSATLAPMKMLILFLSLLAPASFAAAGDQSLLPM
jgi:hypothetical protein